MKHNNIVRGIVICMVVLFVALCVILATPVGAYDGNPIWTKKQLTLHYAADMLREVGFSDDSAPIKALSAAWWQEWEDLNIIAKTIQHEADPQWCEWEHSVAVGVVILNRVESQYFGGDTVKEVVAWPGQYLEWYTYGFEDTTRLAYLAAKAAMDGDHEVPSDCYWQDTSIQGTSIWRSFVCDTGWFRSTTFICRGIPGVN